jgi:hypothetical protein
VAVAGPRAPGRVTGAAGVGVELATMAARRRAITASPPW